MGDSRVRQLTPNVIPVIKTWCKPGAKLYDFYEIAEGELSNLIEAQDEMPLVYVSAGICNLTLRIKSNHRGSPIDEIIVPSGEAAINEQIDSTKEALDDLQRFISRQGGLPILCTLYPMAIGDWNTVRLNQGKTTILSKADQYDDMQRTLEDMVEQVNASIIDLNRQNSTKTPLLNKALSHCRGNRRGPSYRYNLLCDGCHPTSKLNRDLAKSITKTIAINSTVLRARD